MAEKDPNENFLEKIADMLVLIHNNQGKPSTGKNLSPEMDKQLDKLESMMAIYKQITDEALKQCGISPEEIQKKMAGPKTDLPLENQKFLEKAGKLEQELNKLKYIYGIHRQAYEMRHAKKGKKGKEKKFGETRKKKFKRLGGGDKGWMPL